MRAKNITISQKGACLLLLFLLALSPTAAFLPFHLLKPKAPSTVLHSTKSNGSGKKNIQSQSKQKYTLKDLREEIKKKPDAFLPNNGKNKKPKSRRSRKRVESPKQQYLYAKQRKALEREGKLPTKTDDDGVEEGETPKQPQIAESVPKALAREYGLTNPAAQHCDALVDEVEPEILGQVRVGEELKSGSYAYVIHKPAGWSILGGAPSNSRKIDNQENPTNTGEEKPKPNSGVARKNQVTKLEITDVDGSKEVLEYSEADLLAVMTPEEIDAYRAEFSSLDGDTGKSKVTKRVHVRFDDEDEDDELFLDEFEEEEMELLSQLTEEELEIYKQEIGELPEQFRSKNDQNMPEQDEEGGDVIAIDGELTRALDDNDSQDPRTAAVFSKIAARKSAAKLKKASFSASPRPSVVAWLKALKAQEGSPMKGGKYWTALAGATDVDDSGIVIICPKDHVENVFVDYLEYVVVVGNGKNLAPKPKGVVSLNNNELNMDIVSTLRRARGEDAVQTVKVMVPETFSSCSSVLQACQKQFQDGIRGDPAGNPLGRLAHRRLMHCNAVSLSSLVFDETVEVETDGTPDDIAILAERRSQHQYQEGSFLGRSALKSNPLTTAYREINGAADGLPGWTVDRYDKWLFVQHDDTVDRGPLPSIHDGYTAGVYYLPAYADRSAMGSSSPGYSGPTRPQLLEGQPAPDNLSILENGITYHVSLDKDLSTGIFLDQRPQRAWLSRNCNEDTHVLNCFAHCGGFSIAAATAGAATTSLDLNKKWLDRIEPQMRANGVEFDVRHDCIYGDCFDWLSKLAKRGEKYDIVILDPPSSSVGGKKKKRWSIKKDMPELVALAAKVVKNGGLVWCTTNSASITPVKFARLCRQGLEDAGCGSAKLERIQPMPHDFPSIGPQPVKNYVWRLP